MCYFVFYCICYCIYVGSSRFGSHLLCFAGRLVGRKTQVFSLMGGLLGGATSTSIPLFVICLFQWSSRNIRVFDYRRSGFVYERDKQSGIRGFRPISCWSCKTLS